jgi:hypothetical protein
LDGQHRDQTARIGFDLSVPMMASAVEFDAILLLLRRTRRWQGR